MSKAMLNAEDAKNASQEILDMLAVIRSVKGEPYASVVRSVFYTSNFLEAVTPMCSMMPDRDMHDAFRMMVEAHAVSTRDTVKTLMNFLVPKKDEESTEEHNVRWMDTLEEVRKDVMALYNKQTEYGAVVFGSVPPENQQ